MDELEGLAQPLPQQEHDEQDEAEEPSAKRQRVIEPTPVQTPTATGLLSSNALEGLKYVAALKAKNGGVLLTEQPKAQAAGGGSLGALAGYGSDSD